MVLALLFIGVKLAGAQPLEPRLARRLVRRPRLLVMVEQPTQQRQFVEERIHEKELRPRPMSMRADRSFAANF